MHHLASVKYLGRAYYALWLWKVILVRSRRHNEIVIQVGNSSANVLVIALLRFLGRCEWIAALVDSFTSYDSERLNWTVRENGLPLEVAKRIESLAKKANFITVVNKDEARALVASGFDSRKVKCIPLATNVLDAPRILEAKQIRNSMLEDNNLPPESKLVAFHGNLSFPPNREAVDKIMEDIAPRTLRLDRSIYFLMAGAGEPPKEVLPNVRFVGYVRDLETFLSNVDLEIIPLEHGSGMKGKILDALNCALPVVTTEIGISGFEEDDCPIITVAIDDFPQVIVELANNTEKSTRIGKAGWEYVKKHYSNDILRQYLYLVERICLEIDPAYQATS